MLKNLDKNIPINLALYFSPGVKCVKKNNNKREEDEC